MVVISINLPEELVAKLNTAVVELGYRSRSELVREALEEKLGGGGREEGIAYAILVASSHKEYPRVDQKIVAAAYSVAEDLRGLFHATLGEGRCLTLIIVEGKERASGLARTLRGLRGVQKVVVLPV
ncbi:MAG: CopG family ribbon-helix-helix protein [Desulfurococcales archaeon]|nr:CopG family ribbon-helix-helix protein [Desulfurococcales archaeon]